MGLLRLIIEDLKIGEFPLSAQEFCIDGPAAFSILYLLLPLNFLKWPENQILQQVSVKVLRFSLISFWVLSMVVYQSGGCL